MTRPNDHTPAGTLGGMYTDIEILKRRTARLLPERLLPGGFDLATSYRGTAADRDAIYGVPVTDLEKADLANRQINWYDTFNNWYESYFVSGSNPFLALDVRGLITGAPDGWYPIAEGPYQRLRPTAPFAAATSTPVRSWMGTRYRKGGDAWFTYTDINGRVQIKKPGHYRFNVWTTQQAGSGTANYHLRQMNAGITEQYVDGLAYTLQGALLTHANVTAEMRIDGPDREVDFFTHAGSLAVHQGSATTIRGEFTVEYLGPPLNSD